MFCEFEDELFKCTNLAGYFEFNLIQSEPETFLQTNSLGNEQNSSTMRGNDHRISTSSSDYTQAGKSRELSKIQRKKYKIFPQK